MSSNFKFKILATMLVMTLTFANFIFLGTYLGQGLVTYAADPNLNAQDNSTNIQNVKFDLSFELANKTVKTITKNINSMDLKLYAQISVQNGGNVNEATLSFGDKNFKVNEETSLDFGVISSGTASTKEISITFLRETETFNASLLDMESTVKVSGKYINNSGQEENFTAEKKIKITWDSSELKENQVLLTSELVATGYFADSSNGDTIKEYLQFKVVGGTNLNAYPLQQMLLGLSYPRIVEEQPQFIEGNFSGISTLEHLEIPDEIYVANINGANSVNGQTGIEQINNINDSTNNLNIWARENDKISIKSTNLKDGNIVWKAYGSNEFIVTYVYNGQNRFNNLGIYNTVQDNNSGMFIDLHRFMQMNATLDIASGSTTVSKSNSSGFGTLPVMPANPTILNVTNTSSVYKTQFNINSQLEYNTKLTVGVTAAKAIYDNIEVSTSGKDTVYNGNTWVKDVNSNYKSSNINKEEFKTLFGNNGFIEVYADSQLIETITENTPENNGIITIVYPANTNKIGFKLSKPIKEGVLNIYNTELLNKSDFPEAQIKDMSTVISNVSIKTKNTLGSHYNDSTVTNMLELKDATLISKLEINKPKLTTSNDNPEQFTITLKTDDVKYELYTNPIFKVILPEYIKEVKSPSVQLINANGLAVGSSNVVKEGNNQVIIISLSGTQTAYNGSNSNPHIKINATLVTEKLMASEDANITLQYGNNGTVTRQGETPVTIESESGIITAQSASGYNTANDTILSTKNNEATGTLEINKVARNATLKGTIINNSVGELANVKVLGRIPFTGNKTIIDNKDLGTNIDTKLQTDISIAKPSTIYYSENGNATDDLGNNANGWSITRTANAKSYLIVINSIAAKETIEFAYNVQIPANLSKNQELYSTYAVSSSLGTVEVAKLGLETPQEIKIKASMDELITNNNGETDSLQLKAHVQYKVFIENIFNQDVADINIVDYLPEGYTHLESALYAYKNGGYELIKGTTYNASNKTVTTNISKLEVGQKILLSITGLIEEYKTPTIVNKAVITSNDIGKPITLEKSYAVKVPAKFTVLLDSPTTGKEVKAGDEIQYTINVTNNGGTADKVTIRDTIPTGLKATNIKWAEAGKNPTETILEQNYVAINDVTINPGKTFIVQIYAKVAEDSKDGTISNYATIEPFIGAEIKTNTVSHIIKNSTTNPTDPTDPSNPTDPVDPTEPEKPATYKISGTAWLDENKNGTIEEEETILRDITVKLLDIKTNKYVGDGLTTDSKGNYVFVDVPEGDYNVIFEYDTKKYAVTDYKKAGASEEEISYAQEVIEDGKTIVKTDKVTVTDKDITHINIGLYVRQVFDLSLDKYITKITVQNGEGTKDYNYTKSEEAKKVDIKAKYLQGSIVTIEYTIEVTNKGDVAGTAKTLVDYLPPELKFNSSLNTSWYEGTDGNLYSIELGNEEIKPGESKAVKLVLTKTMTSENTGLVRNIAEIYEDYNDLGLTDSNSVAGNKDLKENDLSSEDIIITLKTGEAVMYISIIIVCMAILRRRNIPNKQKGIDGRNTKWKQIKRVKFI